MKRDVQIRHEGSTPRSSIRVLLVDDHPEDRARVADIVTRDVVPVDLQEVEDHVGFFQCLRENRYDIVITEQDLHWSSGHEVLSAVKSLRPAVPVIMLARRADESVAAAAFRDGLDAYIPKSGELAARLKASVRTAVRRLELEERIDGLEDRLDHLLDSLDVGVFRATVDGEILAANRSFLRMFGSATEEGGGRRRLASLFEDPAEYREIEHRVSSEGQVRRYQARLERADGSTAWVSLSLALSKGPGVAPVLEGLAEDVTSQREARSSLEQARDELRAVFEHSGSAIAVLEADGTIVMVNSAFERFSGFGRSDLEGIETWGRFLTVADSDRTAERRRVLLAAPESGSRSGTFEFIGRDGRSKRVLATETALPGGTRSVISLVNHSERQRVEDQLLHNAFHDGLTGLPNRISLFERLVELERRTPSGPAAGCGLILLDLDDFKEINDRHGHRLGDLLLRAIARRIESAVPQADTQARCGSDTFAVLLPPSTDRSGVKAAAEAIREVFANPFRFGHRSIVCTASIGAAWAVDREAIERLFRDAESAMYEARRQGGGRLRYTMPEEVGKRLPEAGEAPTADGGVTRLPADVGGDVPGLG